MKNTFKEAVKKISTQGRWPDGDGITSEIGAGSGDISNAMVLGFGA